MLRIGCFGSHLVSVRCCLAGSFLFGTTVGECVGASNFPSGQQKDRSEASVQIRSIRANAFFVGAVTSPLRRRSATQLTQPQNAARSTATRTPNAPMPDRLELLTRL